MPTGRIFFEGNPWPEGHAIKNFRWSTEIAGSDVWCHLHLETADYDAERGIVDEDDATYESDWAAPSVWGNYHRCIISSDYWDRGGFRLCSVTDFTVDTVDGLRVRVDELPADLENDEERRFHVYLLGHDTVVDHHIAFTKEASTGLFSITWSGKIALTYAGEYEPKYSFRAEITGVPFPSSM